MPGKDSRKTISAARPLTCGCRFPFSRRAWCVSAFGTSSDAMVWTGFSEQQFASGHPPSPSASTHPNSTNASRDTFCLAAAPLWPRVALESQCQVALQGRPHVAQSGRSARQKRRAGSVPVRQLTLPGRRVRIAAPRERAVRPQLMVMKGKNSSVYRFSRDSFDASVEPGWTSVGDGPEIRLQIRARQVGEILRCDS